MKHSSLISRVRLARGDISIRGVDAGLLWGKGKDLHVLIYPTSPSRQHKKYPAVSSGGRTQGYTPKHGFMKGINEIHGLGFLHVSESQFARLKTLAWKNKSLEAFHGLGDLPSDSFTRFLHPYQPV